ncbi:MAG: hypothetical protein AABY53_10725 [Bdellovibrionota bacterium]
MKTFLIVILGFVMSFCSFAYADSKTTSSACEATGYACDTTPQGGVDYWPWSVAQPFPWDHIEGFWKLGEDPAIYLNAHVLSSNNNRKILSLSIHKDSVCSKSSAKGTGYIDAAEKNVVRALIGDGVYKYQLKIAMFDMRDIDWLYDCDKNVMAVSMQLISRGRRPRTQLPPIFDTDDTETHNIMLKKVSPGAVSSCKE